ncbi:Mg(2+) transporter, variant 2 [Orbilia ellipsospora]|uniref:Mg(2+) transporter n=1 Tax=Orbilia ellipsospora TaxID=2528407 RepID=A0AAV9XI42_9PEZI
MTDQGNNQSEAQPRNFQEENLHDHRFQPQSLPRHNTLQSPPNRRPSFTPEAAEQEFTAQFEYHLDEAVRRNSQSSDDIIVGNVVMEDSSDDDHLSPTRYDFEPSASNKARPRGESIARRLQNPQPIFVEEESRSRSPSPPNSIDAFAAARRRDRSGTISSTHAPSELGSLRRSGSRRNLSFENLHATNSGDDETPEKVEDDVCFPMPDDLQRWKIDFDEMEDFITQQSQIRNRSCQRRRKMSTASVQNTYSRQTIPFKFKRSPPEDECAIEDDDDDESDSFNEKEADGVPPKRRGRAPQQPDRFSFFSSELEGTVHAANFPSLIGDGETFEGLFGGEDNVWWLDVESPTEAEMKMIWRAFSLHPLTYEDIRVQETREKVELFRSYYFVSFRSFVQDEESEDFLEPTNIYLVVFRGGVLTFHFSPYPHAANVRKRIRQLRDYVALSSDWICYAMIDDITDSFGPVIHEIEKETDAIEDAVFVARSSDFSVMLRRIGDCRKKVMTLMRLLGGKADVIKGFAKRCNEQYSVTPRSDIGLYLGDIQDHVITMMSNLSHFEKMLSRSHSNYLAQLSVDHMESNNRTNEVLGKITVIATVLVPLNLICGLFGMNVPVPGRNTDNLGWFFGIVGVIVLFVLVSLIAARRMKYI